MTKCAKSLAVAVLAVVATAGVARADTIIYVGDTTGGPTFNRPLAGNPPTLLSGLGTAVAYDVQPFYVTESASFDFLSEAANNWDNFLFLYVDSFDPTLPLTNVLIGNDDFPSIGRSGFSYGLTADVQYFLVTTAFANSDFGAFTNTISGGTLPDNIVLGVVPEPGSFVLAGLGLTAIGLCRLRRRRTA